MTNFTMITCVVCHTPKLASLFAPSEARKTAPHCQKCKAEARRKYVVRSPPVEVPFDQYNPQPKPLKQWRQ
jgi:NAD-dependent SIR2 family protein deacetylase